ncbi:MAG: hypothetical protein ACTHKE_10375 [Sphingomicrobium sp.]|jgi:hypothetical protein
MFLKRLRGEAARQNWFGVAVDLVILILGVFLGIQVNNWNQARIERAEGKEYRQRLISDLDSNQRDLAHRERYYGQVMAHAKAALSALNRPVGDGAGDFLIDAYEASNHIPQAMRRATYDEAVAAGKAQSLGNAMLREQIADFYVGMATMQQIFDNTPPYREAIRSAMPFATQAQVLKDCTEVFQTDRFGSVTTNLPDRCTSTQDPRAAEKAAAVVRTLPNLQWQLNRVVSDLDQKIWNARRLSVEAARLKRELSQAS